MVSLRYLPSFGSLDAHSGSLAKGQELPAGVTYCPVSDVGARCIPRAQKGKIDWHGPCENGDIDQFCPDRG